VRDNVAMDVTRPVDPRGLLFTPVGLGGPMRPEVALDLAQRERERLRLPAVVPMDVRDQFDKVLRLYADGVFSYDNYTTASREAHRLLEVALKVRFLEHYRDGVPLVRAGEVEFVRPRTFDDLRQHLRHGSRLTRHRRFNGSFASLLSWARREGYFFGEHNRIRERMTRKIRNEEFHSEFNYVFMPPDALRRLALVSEMTARLWGGRMPSSIAYPGTVARELMVVGHGPREMEGTQFLLEQLPFVEDEDARDRNWFVVRALWEEELVWWRPEIESTTTPVTRLWGPGSWDDLRAAAAREGASWHTDTARVVDRIFYVRAVTGSVDHVRSAAQVVALRDQKANERWYVVRADEPGSAGSHVARLLAGICKPHGCACAATLFFDRARRETVMRYARAELNRI
jgi:hypothetical protein